MAMTDFEYTPEWLTTQMGTHEWGRRALLGAFAHLGIPERMLDVGCGDGYLCEFAAKLDVPSVGVDIAIAGDRFGPDAWSLLKRDLTAPLDLEMQFDLVISWETGEHLPEESADVFVETLVRHTAGWLIFTAAPPGQGGDGHINCQPQEWWRERFEARGLRYNESQTDAIRATWERATGPCSWYPQNVQVFE